jgi:hypothetical protein
MRTARWGARFVLAASALGVALLAIAMNVYPGGTALDPRAPGHSFWLNFLCDLTAPAARNGVANPVGSLAARAAMLSLSLALGVTWWLEPARLDGRPRARVAIRVAGSLCVASLLVVPLTDDTVHMVSIFIAAAAGLVAGIVTIVAHLRAGGPRRRWLPLTAVLAFTATDAYFYARAVASRPRVVPPALPALQRVAGLLAVAWMLTVAVDILSGRARSPRPRA